MKYFPQYVLLNACLEINGLQGKNQGLMLALVGGNGGLSQLTVIFFTVLNGPGKKNILAD
ncbi:MAG: hypothetical protein HOM11_01330 [Methylococcales bacterium]|nr:hypothetical protein [Methylococcales bacterium]MBT7444864.1 hypothetical protein [Methylococcales bacterium]